MSKTNTEKLFEDMDKLGLKDPSLEVKKMTDEELRMMRFVDMSEEDEDKVYKEMVKRSI
ncbi:hypothetical protein [Enterococcus sp. AZ109]|uniref:hypothetical protein n=1 Tax=Enterococcus sp. AZ109 TaxID=2774634 RepID=UPI003F211027